MDYYENNAEYGFCQSFFAPDEYILWRGKHTGKAVGNDIATVPVGILFLTFAIFWTVTATVIGGAFGLFGLPFIAVGAYLVFGKRAVDRGTKYVITNYKIYRCRRGRVDMIDLETLPSMRVVAGKDGIGSIYFGEHHYYRSGDRRYGMVFSIDSVENIAEVQRIISDAIRK